MAPAPKSCYNMTLPLPRPKDTFCALHRNKITLKAGQPAGMFRAIQTIRQLLPVHIEKPAKPVASLTLPAVTIQDQPAYAWRGMHLDVSRHFYSIDYLKTFIDRLALYKFNTFHLHLTDDQGWRIEIKAYPKLTSIGGWRTFNNQDSVVLKRAVTNPDFDLPKQFIRQQDGQTQYGGFYTQTQMRDLIAYAAARHIDIVPEIDMPGHLSAAIKAYPFLSCTGQDGWGKTFSVPVCPCNEPTYTFMETVLSEIIALFPSQYVHIGADEVEKSTWAKTPACLELMKREKLNNVEELQSYFVHRIEQFVQSKGKKLMVWDDALEGGLKPSSTVMYWRSWVKNAPQKAAQNGNNVVMTPVSHLYFDSQPNIQSVENVYNLPVVPEGIPASQTGQFSGRAGQHLDGIHPDREPRRLHEYAPHDSTGRDGLVGEKRLSGLPTATVTTLSAHGKNGHSLPSARPDRLYGRKRLC